MTRNSSTSQWQSADGGLLADRNILAVAQGRLPHSKQQPKTANYSFDDLTGHASRDESGQNAWKHLATSITRTHHHCCCIPTSNYVLSFVTGCIEPRPRCSSFSTPVSCERFSRPCKEMIMEHLRALTKRPEPSQDGKGIACRMLW